MLGQVRLDLRDDVGVVRAALVEPEHGRVAGGAGPADRELDPVLDRRRPWSGTCARCRPRSTACSNTVRRRRRRRAPCLARISKVLSWLPYSSAARAISPTLGTEPMVAGSEGAVARGSRRSRPGRCRRSCCRAAPRGCRPRRRPGPTCGRRCGCGDHDVVQTP